ncbi:MAG: hypothetical protein FJ304_03700 [Planctomycetes bacterium]|nr:hypothetical protein [Planctomycetota bacterium]
MDELPADVRAAVPADALPAVERWWRALTDTERRGAAEQWDERRESHLFAPQPDEVGDADTWEQVPAARGGRFVPRDDARQEEKHDWFDDRYEYLVEHEEVVVMSRFAVFRTFHIYQLADAAQEVLATGRLGTDFRCPHDAAACPMHRVRAVAPKAALYLTPAAAGGWWVVAQRDPA